MSSIRTSTVFRVKNVPSGCTVSDLEKILRGKLADEEKLLVEVTITFVPSCYSDEAQCDTKWALLEFRPIPAFLLRVANDITVSEMFYLKVGESTMTIDVNFYGFTQLYDVKGTEITADIIAVTGLGGHAYGSWRGKQTKKMWLRDFLVHDLPNFRTMTYGYNTNLNTRGFHTLKDYKSEFLQEIARIRNSEDERKRPIIFIGHSFGGIVILQSLVEAATIKRENESFAGDEYLVAATCAVMFFATPHRGILMEDVRRMLEEDSNHHPRIHLLEEIASEANLEPPLKEFIRLAAGFKIVSFYERIQTAEVAKNSQNQFTRSGNFKSTLDIDSAILHLPGNIEEAIPVDANHTNIVKFESRDHRTYEILVKRVQKFMETAPDQVKEKFRVLDEIPVSPLSSDDASIMGDFMELAGVIKALICACTKGYAMLSEARNVEDLGNLQMRRKVAKQKFINWAETIQPRNDPVSAVLGAPSRKYVVIVEILAKMVECFRKIDEELTLTLKSKPPAANFSNLTEHPQSSRLDSSESVTQKVREILTRSNVNFWSGSNSFNILSPLMPTLNPRPISDSPVGVGISSWTAFKDRINGINYHSASGLESMRFPSADKLTQLSRKDDIEALSAVKQFKVNGMRFQEAISTYEKARWALRGKEDLIKIISELESHNNNLFKVMEKVKQVRGASEPKTRTKSVQESFNVRVNLPFERNAKFCARNDILDKISQILGSDTRNKPRKKTVVLHGMGGIGKSQIALEYAHRFSARYTSIFWIDAYDADRTKDTAFKILEQLVEHYAAKQQSPPDFHEIAKKLLIPGKIGSSGTINHDAAGDAIKKVHAWLSASGNLGWLLLVDNYENAELSVLSTLIPKCDWGHIIITTRFPNFHRFGECVEVEEIGSEEGLRLLLQSSGKLRENLDESELDDAKEIVSALGELPLALHQAGVYISSLRKSFRDYLNKLEKGMKASFKKSASDLGLPSEKASVLTTWELSIQELDDNARHLLHICAYLSNEEIPEELFYRGKNAIAWLIKDDDALEAAMESLFNLSLARRKQSTDSFWIHPLVHAWVRQRNDIKTQRRNAQDAIKVVEFSITIDTREKTPDDWIFLRRILSHLGDSTANMSAHFSESVNPRAARCLSKIASAYVELGHYERAKELYEQALARNEKVLGSHHPTTLEIVNNMANVFREQGQYAKSLQWYKKVLAGRDKVLGSEHQSTLNSVNGMALVSYLQGRHDDALELYGRVLVGKEKAFGSEHPSTLNVVNNMALVFYSQGRYDKSLEWYERALAGKEKALGVDHPSTLDTVNNMAMVFEKQARYDKALEWYGRALAGQENVLGSDHPTTLNTMNNMALVFDLQGRCDKALELYGRALTGQEKALGRDHPLTIGIVNNMALVFYKQGRYDEALKLYGRALAGIEKTLGIDHPTNLDVVNNMAIVFDKQAQYDKALEWFGRALVGKEKVLGSDHPTTLDTVNNMAMVFGKLGQHEKALEWYGRALAGNEKALGSDHPSTLNIFNNMAMAFEKQGRYDKALELYERALAGQEKVLGGDHLSTLATVNNMAGLFDSQGRHNKAIEWYGRALAGTEKALGSDHPTTIDIVDNMATLFRGQGQYDKALECFGRELAGKEKAFGSDHPSTLDTVYDMAVIFDNQGRHEKSLELYGRVLAGKEKTFGSDHLSTLDIVNNMAIIFDKQGRYDKALEWYGRALAGKEKALGGDHSSTLALVYNMASVFHVQGQYDKAVELYGRALAGKEKTLGIHNPSTLHVINNMAIVFRVQGRYDKALELYEKALAGKEMALGYDHPSTLDTVYDIAVVFEHQRRYDQAHERYERALAGQEKSLGSDHPATLDTVHNMAIVFGNLGQHDKAFEWFGRALAGKEKVHGIYHPSTLRIVSDFTSYLDRHGRCDEAMELKRRYNLR